MRTIFSTLLSVTLLMFTVLPLVAEDTNLSVEANRNQLYLGESFILQINVSGTGEADPDLSQIKNGKIRSLGKQNISNYSISFVNGQMTRQGFSGLIVTYEITPLSSGPFRAGPIAVTVNGKRLTAEGPTLTVTDIEKQDQVYLSITSSRETVLIDESFDVTLTVRIKRIAGRFANTEPLFPENPPILTIPWLTLEGLPGLNGPDLNQLLNKLLIQNSRPGFAINDYTRQSDPFDFASLMSGGRRRAMFAFDHRLASQDGKDYMEYSITLSYAPVDEGNYVFGPAVFKGSVPVEVDENGQAHGMAVFAVGPACTVRVIPPPEQNRPACFSGAIGSNLTAKAVLDATTCSVGDPLKLTLELAGRVRFDKMLPPKLTLQTNLLSHFTIYDNTVQTDRKGDTCRYTYTLRPLHAGAFQVPPIEVAYYDVKSREYKIIATELIPLAVKKGSEVTGSQIVGNTNRLQAVSRIEDDRTKPIAAARTGMTGSDSVPLLGNPAWLALAGAGPVLFLLGLMFQFYREHNEQHRAALRRQQAMPHAWRRLSRAIKLSAIDTSAAADEVCDAIRQYVSERLGVPAAGITPEDTRRMLTAASEPPAIIASKAMVVADDPVGELCRIFENYFNAGFSTQTEFKDIGVDCRKLRKLIPKIELALRKFERRKRRQAVAQPLLLIAGSLILFSCLPAHALDASERAFIWNEGQAHMAAARTPEDYLRAAQTYQKLVDAGVRNGPLFYNLGTAFLHAGQIAPAIDALQRAEQFLGFQNDIRQNLKIAMARKANNETAEWPWYRLVMFWHFYLSAATRLMVTAIAFFVFWVILILRLLGIRRGDVNTIMILAALAMVLFGSSVATSWHQAATSGSYQLVQQTPPDSANK